MRIFKTFSMLLPILLIISCSQNESLYQTDELQQIAMASKSRNLKSVSQPKDTVNFLMHWKGEGGREQFLKEYAQLFRWTNQDVYLTITDIDDDPQVHALETANYMENVSIYAANMIQKRQFKYNVIPIEDVNLEPFLNDPNWLKHNFVNFKTVPGFSDTQLSDLIKGHDMIPGPMLQGYYWTIYVNTRLDSIMGLNVKQMGMTMEDFVRYVSKVNAYNRAHNTNYAVFAEIKNPYRTGNLFRQIFKSALGYNNDYPVYEYCTRAQRSAYLQSLRALEEITGFKNVQLIKYYESDYDVRESMLLKDECVFLVDGTWMYNVWEGIDKSKIYKLMPAELPVIKPTSNYLGIINEAHAVLKNSPQSAQAVKFLMLLSSKDAAEDWVRMTKSPTGVKRYINIYGRGGDAYENFIYQMLDKYGTNLSYVLDDIYFGSKNPRVENVDILSLMEGRETAAQIFNRIMKTIQMM